MIERIFQSIQQIPLAEMKFSLYPASIDIVLGIILLVSAIVGAKKGLFLSMARLLTLLLSAVGAGWIVQRFQEPLTLWATPFFQKYLSQAFLQLVERWETPTMLFPQGGVFLQSTIQQRVEQVGSTIAEAAVYAVLHSLLGILLFALAFTILFWILRLAVRALNLAFHLPILHGFNAMGGFFFGLFQGLFWLYLLTWLLYTGYPDWLEPYRTQSLLLSFLTQLSPRQLLGNLV